MKKKVPKSRGQAPHYGEYGKHEGGRIGKWVCKMGHTGIKRVHQKKKGKNEKGSKGTWKWA